MVQPLAHSQSAPGLTPAQLLIHDIVDDAHLPSAVRLGATTRYVGTLLGPAVGNGLMLLLGPALGIFFNALIYLPMFVWLWKAPYGARFRQGASDSDVAVRGLGDAIATLRSMRGNHIILTMTLLAGAASFFVGTAYQAQMPNFATDLGHGNAGLSYAALAAADAAGGLCAAVMLESRGLLMPRVPTALLLCMLWCGVLGIFALTHSYALSLAALFCAGFLELSFGAMAQALVQLNAPAALRGHVIGVFVMAALGLRFVSGFTVGIAGAVSCAHCRRAFPHFLLLAKSHLGGNVRPGHRERARLPAAALVQLHLAADQLVDDFERLVGLHRRVAGIVVHVAHAGDAIELYPLLHQVFVDIEQAATGEDLFEFVFLQLVHALSLIHI